MNTTDIINHDKQDYFPVFARYDIVLDHGDGPYLYDTNGKAYLDYLAGIAVNVVGHNYPPLVDAIATQAAKMIHCSNLYYTEVQAEAAAKLKALSGMDKVFFANSGAEANEGAIKLARKYATAKDPEKVQIITALHSFHGRTLATLTATGQEKYHQALAPYRVVLTTFPSATSTLSRQKLTTKPVQSCWKPFKAKEASMFPMRTI